MCPKLFDSLKGFTFHQARGVGALVEGWKAERSSGCGRKERDPCPAVVSPRACARGEPLQVLLGQEKRFSMQKEAGAPVRAARAGRAPADHGRVRRAGIGRSETGAGGISLLPALLGSGNMRSFTQKLHCGVVVFRFFPHQIIFKCSFVAKDDFV